MAKVLVVDDSITSRCVLRAMLTNLGHTIVGEAANGVEGFDLYFQVNPDIVTMDVTMPFLDGIGSTEKIIAKDPEAKILLVTSNAQVQTIEKATNVGCKGFIHKPISDVELGNLVESVLNS